MVRAYKTFLSTGWVILHVQYDHRSGGTTGERKTAPFHQLILAQLYALEREVLCLLPRFLFLSTWLLLLVQPPTSRIKMRGQQQEGLSVTQTYTQLCQSSPAYLSHAH